MSNFAGVIVTNHVVRAEELVFKAVDEDLYNQFNQEEVLLHAKYKMILNDRRNQVKTDAE